MQRPRLSRLTRLALAIAAGAPFVMSGCATLSADKTAETAAIAVAAAQAAAKDSTTAAT